MKNIMVKCSHGLILCFFCSKRVLCITIYHSCLNKATVTITKGKNKRLRWVHAFGENTKLGGITLHWVSFVFLMKCVYEAPILSIVMETAVMTFAWWDGVICQIIMVNICTSSASFFWHMGPAHHHSYLYSNGIYIMEWFVKR